MKLYHGSKSVVANPINKGSKDDNDYGPAFYMTKDLESAHEWACKNNTVGIVNEYKLDTRGLKILDLTNKEKYTVLNWLAVLLHYRGSESSLAKTFAMRLDFIEKHYFIDVNDYDLVIGYRADDAYFRFPADFIRGNLTLEQLEYSFNLGELGIQYVITSQKGIDHLSFVKSFPSEDKYINQYFNTVTRATLAFDALNKDEEGIRIIDLMRNKK